MSVVNSILSANKTATHHSVIIIGAGQAGMSMSYHLKQKNIDHILLEKNVEIAKNWQDERWDAFCLVTPNWQCQLPGYHYNGDDPDGFMVKDEIIEYLKGYYDKYKPPVRFNTTVKELVKHDELFSLVTDKGELFTADSVVLACGSYHQINILPFAKDLDENITQVHSKDYKNPDCLPEGEVLVIGTGQSGCQIAEDLHLAGRKVHLCVGPAPRVNRRYRGKDVVAWLEEMGYYNTTIDQHPDGSNAPHSTNHYVTGRDGGRDLNLRIFAEQGMRLYGLLDNIENNTLKLRNDLQENLDYADNVAKRIRDNIEQYITQNNIDAPKDDNIDSSYTPEYVKEVSLSEHNITSVIWATGFKMQFDWVKLPIFSERGQPIHKRGTTAIDGIYFLGLNWMHTWGSGRFFHVGKDAEYLSQQIALHLTPKENLCMTTA
ncbi:MSMEG_0569 family flavin-dependent oxidoreductase [Agarilytica rhodophyticola]|uniref:MSMEG_0569 family flavin-dependent oxidoreductase n=1 Tax=Agarilytica rhodophyticola TaxID=1737490 RepID=UPI000B344501|nr:MSMEG_0569 family flavin-dependent oxidoreductase [Agarilytica rhodophyticola]